MPNKKGKRGVDEARSQPTKLRMKYVIVTFTKCHNKVHNSRKCKGHRVLVNHKKLKQKGRNRVK